MICFGLAAKELQLFLFYLEQRFRKVLVIDHYHLSSNHGVGVSEVCFVFDFASLPVEVARPIYPIICTKLAVKNQSSSDVQSLLIGVTWSSDIVFFTFQQ